MNKPLIAVIAFVVSAAIVLGIEQFLIHLSGAVLKLIIGVVIGLIVAAIAFVVVKEPAKS